MTFWLQFDSGFKDTVKGRIQHMNTAEIIERCRELPGVTVSTGDGYAELMLSNAEGKGRMRFCPVFPGITLAGISVGAPV